MKKYILLLILPFLFSCNSEWCEGDKEKLKDEVCYNHLSQDQCDCLLDKFMGKFSSFEECDKLMNTRLDEDLADWINSVADECR